MRIKGPEVEKLVARWVFEIQNELDGLLPKNPSEEEFRREIHPLLAAFCAEFGAHAELVDGYTLADGRADSAFYRVVVGYPRRGYLNLGFTRATDSAIGRFLGDLHRMAGDEKSAARSLAGVLFDGHCIVFVQYVKGNWNEERITAVDRKTLRRLLVQLSGTACSS